MSLARTLGWLKCFSLAAGAGLSLAAPRASAAILFEGYSKVLLAGAHVGFMIERYEYDEKKKEFAAAYLLQTTTPGGTMMESLRARASASLSPLSYRYTSLEGAKARSIDATVKGEEMTLKIRDGKAARTTKTRVAKGALLSRFLPYLLLQGKNGMKTGAKYAYQAIAEEDGGVYPGEAYVEGREDVAGNPAFKVAMTYKGTKLIGLMTEKGEILASRAPRLALATEVVAEPKEALSGQGASVQAMQAVFGGAPEGKENAIARQALAQRHALSHRQALDRARLARAALAPPPSQPSLPLPPRARAPKAPAPTSTE